MGLIELVAQHLCEEEIASEIASLNIVDRAILLLLAAKGGQPVMGALWLQKELYHLQKAIPQLAEDFDFEPHFFGPYSQNLAEEVQKLKDSGLTEEKRFSLASRGRLLADVIAKNADKKALELIEEFKDLLNDMSEDELLAFTYFSHENPSELEKESVAYNNLVPKRKQIAVSLFQKDKISAQKAAQIAGMHLEDFLGEVKKAVG